jgi:hypothetical protein
MRLRASAGAGLAFGPQRVLSGGLPLGNTTDRPLRVAPFGAIGAFLVMASSGLAGGHRRSQHGLGLQPGIPLPSLSPPQEGCAEAGGVEGGFPSRHPILGSPDVVRQPSVASSSGSAPPPLPRCTRGRPRDGGTPSVSGTFFFFVFFSSRLEDLRGSWGSQRRVRQVFLAYRGRMGPFLRGPVCEGLAILQSLPARFLRSSPSSVSEGRDGLPYSPLRRGYVVEFHSHP